MSKDQIDNYRLTCQRIIGGPRFRAQSASSVEQDRLSFQDIQNITRSMFRNKKAQTHNPGVLTSIKGKMYCLKLGQVGQQKEFSHYFYTSQYRRMRSKQDRLEEQKEQMKKIMQAGQARTAQSKPKKLRSRLMSEDKQIKNTHLRF